MKVEWTRRGELRLRQCRDYLLELTQDPQTAYKFEDGLIDTSLRLADFPLSGTIVRELGRKDIRELIYEGYRLIYKHTRNCCYVLSIRHHLYQIETMRSL